MGEWLWSPWGGFLLKNPQGEEARVPSRKAAALFAILVLKPHRSRVDLASWLWPGHPPSAARDSLRQALAVLRTILGPEAVTGDRESIQLHLPVRVIPRPHAGEFLPGFDELPLSQYRTSLAAPAESPSLSFKKAAGALLDAGSPASADMLAAGMDLFTGLHPQDCLQLSRRVFQAVSPAHPQWGWVLYASARSAISMTRLVSARTTLEQSRTWALAHGDGPLYYLSTGYLTHIAILQGDWAAADRMTQALEDAAQDDAKGAACQTSLYVRALLCHHQGRKEEGQALLQKWRRAFPHVEGVEDACRKAIMGLFLCIYGDPEAGLRLQEQAAEPFKSWGYWRLESILAMGRAASASAEEALPWHEKVAQLGEEYQCADFMVYGLEGQAEALARMGLPREGRLKLAASRKLRVNLGMIYTHWDRARLPSALSGS